jgi:hypothetical protein
MMAELAFITLKFLHRNIILSCVPEGATKQKKNVG